MNYKQAAQSAIDCQNACNLSGVVFSFARAMQAVCDEGNRLGKGTEWKNKHPIVTLYLDKLGSLNGHCGDLLAFSSAIDQCEQIVKEYVEIDYDDIPF